MRPRVSVLMSVYNNEKYLETAVESILNQTFTDFEFIIIDDGSLDSSPGLLAHYQQDDPRISIHRLDHNQGLSIALNFGIQFARGEYIARMDGDDISLPKRLEEQVAYMDAHPEIGICGTWVELIGDNAGQVWKYPTQHEAIHARLLFANTLVHPSVMVRVSSLKTYSLFYDETIRYAQDYELWSRAVASVRLANLDQILLQFRIHAQSTGGKHLEKQYQTHDVVYRRLFSPLNLVYSNDDLLLHRQIGAYQYRNDIEFLRRTRKWLEAISRANKSVNLISPDALDAELGLRWMGACNRAQLHPIQVCYEILMSSLQFSNSKGLLKIPRAIGFCLGNIISVNAQ